MAMHCPTQRDAAACAESPNVHTGQQPDERILEVPHRPGEVALRPCHVARRDDLDGIGVPPGICASGWIKFVALIGLTT
jgi:hypothetical protein